MTRILFVCTANVCRSPFAQSMLTDALADFSTLGDVVVESAGTRALPGEPLCALAGSMVGWTASGAKFARSYRTRQLERAAVEEADLVLTAEVAHRGIASALAPGAQGRIFTLLEAADLAEFIGENYEPVIGKADIRFARWVVALDEARGLVPARGQASRLHRLLGRRPHELRSPVDIPDGHPRRSRRHRETLDSVGSAVERLVRSMHSLR